MAGKTKRLLACNNIEKRIKEFDYSKLKTAEVKATNLALESCGCKNGTCTFLCQDTAKK